MLAYIMKTLNDRYDYGLKLVLLSIDEGITGKKASNKYIFADKLEIFPKPQKFFTN